MEVSCSCSHPADLQELPGSVVCTDRKVVGYPSLVQLLQWRLLTPSYLSAGPVSSELGWVNPPTQAMGSWCVGEPERAGGDRSRDQEAQGPCRPPFPP